MLRDAMWQTVPKKL